jgi:hypothetical protein
VFLKVAEQASEGDMPDEVRRSRLEDLTDSKWNRTSHFNPQIKSRSGENLVLI